MKNPALFSSKDENEKLKCRLLQFLFSALRVNFGRLLVQISVVMTLTGQALTRLGRCRVFMVREKHKENDFFPVQGRVREFCHWFKGNLKMKD